MSRVGKSIEEIILQRKNDDGIPSPCSLSSPMFSPLRKPKVTSNSNKRRDSNPNHPMQKNDKEVIESLLDHAQQLQIRNKELEGQLLLSNNTISKLFAEVETLKRTSSMKLVDSIPRLNPQPRNVMTLEPLHVTIPPATHQFHQNLHSGSQLKNQHFQAQGGVRKGDIKYDSGGFSRTVYDMEEQLTELRHMFSGTNPIHQRTVAALKIQTRFRSYSTRKRFNAYQLSFQSWRSGRSRNFLPFLQLGLERAGEVEMALNALSVRREFRLIVAIFSRWKHICKQSAPFRLSIRSAAEEKYFQFMFRLKSQAFLALKTGTLGIDSHKHIRRERRKMIERAKTEILAKMRAAGVTDLLVSEEDVKRVVYREIVSTSLTKRETRNKAMVFHSFKTIYLDAVSHNKVAYNHKFRRFAGRCFYAWSDWTYQVGTGLERKRWTGPRKYEVRYNQKLVEHFGRTRLKKMTLGPWKRYSRVSRRVNELYMKQLSSFVKTHLVAWKVLTRKICYLRKTAIGRWKEYPTVVMCSPFFAWKQFASTATVRRIQQDSLVNAYIRWKDRQKNIRILRAWRHQSLYGGIEGMYSRTKISKSLGEQKSMSAALQKLLTKQTIDLEECKEAVHRETMLRKKMEDRVAERDAEIEIHRTKIHHLEIELKRLHAIIDAMAVVNPRQIQHIKSIQPDFEFRVRKLQPSLDIASEDDLFKVDDAKPKPVARQGSLQLGSSLRSARRADQPMATMAPPSSSGSSSSSQTNSLSLEDRRLLARAKWLLKRLLIENDEEKQSLSEREHITDELDEHEEDHYHALRAAQQKEASVESLLKNLLNDKADRKEVFFVLNILSFLKDGNAKCLGEEDCRSWTAELLQSIGRNTDIVSSIMGVKSQHDLTRKGLPEETVDLGSWREVMMHLRAHYPIGLTSEPAHVHFQDASDPSHVGTLNRIHTMRHELQDVIRYKREKVQLSSSGKQLLGSIAPKGTDVGNLGAQGSDSGSSLNLYAENLSSALAVLSSGSGSAAEENLSQYDSISLQSPIPNLVGSLLTKELGLESDFKLK